MDVPCWPEAVEPAASHRRSKLGDKLPDVKVPAADRGGPSVPGVTVSGEVLTRCGPEQLQYSRR